MKNLFFLLMMVPMVVEARVVTVIRRICSTSRVQNNPGQELAKHLEHLKRALVIYQVLPLHLKILLTKVYHNESYVMSNIQKKELICRECINPDGTLVESLGYAFQAGHYDEETGTQYIHHGI